MRQDTDFDKHGHICRNIAGFYDPKKIEEHVNKVFNEGQYIFRAEHGSVERSYIDGTPCLLCDNDYSLCDDI